MELLTSVGYTITLELVEEREEYVPLLEFSLFVVGGDGEGAEHVISVIQIASLMMAIQWNEMSVAPICFGIIEVEWDKDGIVPGRIVRMPIEGKDLEIGCIAVAFRYSERP